MLRLASARNAARHTSHAIRMAAAAGVMLGCLAPATAHAQAGSGLLITFAARVCPTYTDISANRARNDIQESLRDLGPDTTYEPGEMIDPTVEQAVQPNCTPLPGWTFTLGTGYRTRAVSGPWGSLSIVTSPFTPAVTTLASTPLLNDLGQSTGHTIAGAATLELSAQQAAIAAHPNSLWVQGGTPADPILDQPFPGQYGFGALRCAIDDLNGDNVEWVGYPSGVRHVFCFAYYVKPPPTSGTIVIRKQVQGPAGTAESFPFEGNISFNADGRFTLAAATGGPAEASFYRAETHPGEQPWSVRELVPADWRLTGLACASGSGASTTTTNLASATATIALAPADTVTCTYADEPVPPQGGLLIRKVTTGATGRFAFNVAPAGGGTGVTSSAETRQEGVPSDAQPGPLSLAPGSYALTESPPAATRAGSWSLTGAQCDGAELPLTQPIAVTVSSGHGTVCTLTNTFLPRGAITLAKITRGALATTGFVITPAAGPPFELHQSAITTREGSPAAASGEPARGLVLGRYLIQETTPEPAAGGHWELTAVTCGRRVVPFADGAVSVVLNEAHPALHCVFTNTHRPGAPPLPPAPVAPGPALPIVNPEADLALTKRALGTQLALGGVARFELHVANHGPSAAEAVVVDDQPAAPATLVSAQPSQGSCGRSLPLTCPLGMLAAGHGARILVVLRPRLPGPFTNRAVAGTATLDGNLANNAASAGLLVLRSHLPAFTG